MYDKLRSILIDELLLRPEDIRPEASLAEAGLDSLGLVELSMVLGKRHGIEVSDDELIETMTVAEFADRLAELASARLTPTSG